ncbi:N-acetylglucosamine-6-phosphate deacetylase, partial [Rhizobium phaseoli]
MARKIFIGARIFDGERFHDDKALIVADGRVEAIVATNDLPDGETETLAGGVLSAGFIDAQVNGGGGRMLNDEPSAASMEIIAQGHR